MNFFTFVFTFVFSLRAGFWIFFPAFPGRRSRISFLRRGLGSSFLLFLAGGPEFPSCGGVLELLSSFSWQNVQNFFLAARDRTFILLFHDGRSIFLLLHSLFGHFSLVPRQNVQNFFLAAGFWIFFPAFLGGMSRISFLRRGFGYSFQLFLTGGPEFNTIRHILHLKRLIQHYSCNFFMLYCNKQIL